MQPTVADWIAHLRALAGSATRSAGDLGLGVMEPAFRAAVERGAAPATPAIPDKPLAGETALWWAIHDDSIDVDTLIAARTAGSLLPQGLFRTIEVWTEADLSGLHALWRLARERGRRDWRERIEAVRLWHLEHTQPDNATNRPWALHVFLRGPEPESRHYAETLLHNAIALSGTPDPLSALILIDAANELELA